MSEAQLSGVEEQGAPAPASFGPERSEALALARPGLWQPALLALCPLAAVACLTAPWSFGAPSRSATAAELLRIAGWVTLAGTAAAAALAWVWRGPTRRRIVFEDGGFWMPPFPHASGSIWIPYQDVHAVHRWRQLGRRQIVLVLSLRGRLPRYWSERAFVDPEALKRFTTSVRAGVARLPDGAERLHEIDRRAASAAAARRGWPRVSLAVVLVLTAVYAVEARLFALDQSARVLALASGPEALGEGELFRLVTATLLHADELHLMGNLLGLLIMGELCERLVGRWRFLVVLLGSALGGTLASSALTGLHAVGASGALYGALACLAYLMTAYRDEVPGTYHPPLRWCAFAVALGIALKIGLEEVLWRDDIDHIAHAGGFVAGLGLSALTIRGRPLAALSRTPSRLATRLAGGFLVLYAGGVAWGIQAVDGLPLTERANLESAMRQLGREHLPPGVRNNAAWQVAVSPLATHEALRAARAAADQETRERPDDPPVRDTLATLHFRLGDAETAAEIERRVLREKPDAFIASQLARFERARLRAIAPGSGEDLGVLRVAGSEPQVRFDSPAAAGVLDVYALVEEPDGTLGGLGWLTLRCGSGGAGDCAVRAPDLPGTSALVVAHVAPAPEGAEAPAWRFWPLDPEVAALPGPLPPEEGSLGSEGASP